LIRQNREQYKEETKTKNINGTKNEGEWKKETYGKGRDVHTT